MLGIIETKTEHRCLSCVLLSIILKKKIKKKKKNPSGYKKTDGTSWVGKDRGLMDRQIKLVRQLIILEDIIVILQSSKIFENDK